MTSTHKILAGALLGALASGAHACATVADLDVTRGPDGRTAEPPTDLDDGGTTEDGQADTSTTPVDSGVEAAPQPPPPPAVCSCPMDQACCVPSGGAAGACTSVTGGDACRASNGLFLRCAGPDIANGRLCCFTADMKGTSYFADCPDAGPELCANASDCTTGTCQMFPCRGASVGMCAEPGATPPTCPP